MTIAQHAAEVRVKRLGDGPECDVRRCPRPVGEIRETSDDTMVTFQDFGLKSVAFLRDKLSLPSKDGVRSVEKR
jgi:hypothetical protein